MMRHLQKHITHSPTPQPSVNDSVVRYHHVASTRYMKLGMLLLEAFGQQGSQQKVNGEKTSVSQRNLSFARIE